MNKLMLEVDAGVIPAQPCVCGKCGLVANRIPLSIERRYTNTNTSYLVVTNWSKPDGWNYLLSNDHIYCDACYDKLYAAIHRIINAS